MAKESVTCSSLFLANVRVTPSITSVTLLLSRVIFMPSSSKIAGWPCVVVAVEPIPNPSAALPSIKKFLSPILVFVKIKRLSTILAATKVVLLWLLILAATSFKLSSAVISIEAVIGLPFSSTSELVNDS